MNYHNISISQNKFELELIQFINNSFPFCNKDVYIGHTEHLFPGQKIDVYKLSSQLDSYKLLSFKSHKTFQLIKHEDDNIGKKPLMLFVINFFIQNNYINDIFPYQCFSDLEIEGILEELKTWRIVYSNNSSETFHLDFFDTKQFIQNFNNLLTMELNKSFKLHLTSQPFKTFNKLLLNNEFIAQKLSHIILNSIQTEKNNYISAYKYFKFSHDLYSGLYYNSLWS